MGSIDELCARMRYWCEEADLGYDQSNRWDIRDGGECDCSSLVIFALREAGFDTGSASYTGDMSAELCARGWERLPADGRPAKGDILLNDRSHVAVWLGDRLAQASIDERGRASGGRAGDQTGRETNTRKYYDYPWDCYLRYEGGDDMTPDDLLYTTIAVQDSDGQGQTNTEVWQTWSWAMRYAQRACQMLAEVQTQNAALTEAVRTLAGSIGADPDEVAGRVAAAVERKLEGLNVVVGFDG